MDHKEENKAAANMQQRYVYHITDRHNLDSIVRQGLLSASLQRACSQGDVNVKHLPSFFKPKPYENRVVMETSENDEIHYRIDDCVQMLFAAKDPRLFGIINSKNIDQDRIIFLCMRADKISKLGGCVSDRYAKAPEYTPGEEPRFYDDLNKASEVMDWKSIDSNPGNLKDAQLKEVLQNWPQMAQAFIPDRLDFDQIDAVVVFDPQTKNEVQNQLSSLGVDTGKVQVYTEEEACTELPNHPRFYFYKDNILDHEAESLVTGPRELYNEYLQCIKEIKDYRKQKSEHNSGRFEDVESLVEAIEKDFTVLPELKGIYRLETDTQAHHEDVGAHTLTTVRNLEDSQYYKNANEHLKSVIKLSAYLHDIGKGPKQKWPEGVQHRYPDHPRDSVPMLKRILTEEIKNLSDKDIRRICLMVIFHDVVGECQNKGRDYQQVADLIESEEDLDHLYCISEADIRSISEEWYEKFISLEDEFRQEMHRRKHLPPSN